MIRPYNVLYISFFQDLSLLILATDMSRHAEILQEFKERSIKFDSTSSKDLTSLKLILIKVKKMWNQNYYKYIFFKKNREIKIIINIYIFFKNREIIIIFYTKACDVSNELRPTDVSELWVERLMQEYFQQVSSLYFP